jgi:hypothetical protein
LKDTNWTLLNPRREDWDSSWVQSIENEQFAEQVDWELSAMEAAEKILMYFDPNTKSPATLLELGLNAREFGKLKVCCPDAFGGRGMLRWYALDIKYRSQRPLTNSSTN